MGTLFDQLTALPILVRAFDRVEENQGGPGVDRETVLDFGVALERNLMSLRKALVTGTYCPSPLLLCVGHIVSFRMVWVVYAASAAEYIAALVIGLLILDSVGEPLIQVYFSDDSSSQTLLSKEYSVQGLRSQIHLKMLLIFASIALLLGVILQIFWHEKPVTASV